MPDAVHVSIDVEVPPDQAFALFTDEIDLWWQRNRAYRVAADSMLRFEPQVGGRFMEIRRSGEVRIIGTVTAWQPGQRLAFEWRGANFRPGEVTDVEVRFEAIAMGTRVLLHHWGFDSLADDHPVRHGRPPAQLIASMGRWWATALTHLKRHQQSKTKESQP